MPIVHVNKNNFDKEVKKSGTPVIMDFWADWCGPCRMMGPVFEDLSKDYTGKLKFAKVDTEESQDIAGEYEIHGIPTLVVVNKGKEIDRIVGFCQKPVLKAKIDSILKKI